MNEDIFARYRERQEAVLDAALSEILPRMDAKIRSKQDLDQYQFQKEVIPRLVSTGFEERFHREIPNLNNPKQESVLAMLEESLIENGAIVAIVGSRGTGKTTLAGQIAIRRIRAWLNYHALPPAERPAKVPLEFPRYRKAADLLARFKPLYSDFGSIDTERLMEERDYECLEWSLLVVDEWHECRDLQMKDRLMADIIDRRYAAKRDTLIISNQEADEFRQTTDPSIMSRLGQHGRIIPCRWTSYRIQ
jgi:DNA replication protein DnaC